MNTPTNRRIPLAGLSLALLIAAGCRGPEPSASPHEAPLAAGNTAGQPAQEHDHDPGEVRFSAELAGRMGVALAEAMVEDLERDVRAIGEIVPDETRLTTVSLRYGGWAERLHADFTGRAVRAGEPLLEVYSPELVSAQEDLLAAVRLAESLEGSRVPGSRERADAAVEAARQRLRFWQVPGEVIRRVEESREVQATFVVPAPFAGHVVEKGVQAGERFEAGTPLYRLAELSTLWLEAEVYERDLPHVRVGTAMEVELAGLTGARMTGRVDYVYPTVDRDRRTARIRLALPNPDGTLKPGMFATARARVTVAEAAVTVPRDAVLHTGERAVVFVALGGDRYAAREVSVGREAGERVEILSGVEPGERVVARAGFLLDAESRLMEAMMGQPGMPGMDMDMPGMEMDEPDMEMDMPGMEMGGDRYGAREVSVGREAGDRVEILSAVEAGERVVARAGFLLDAESRLMEAMMGQPGMPGMEMEMDMPGMEMDEPDMEMDMPGMEMGGHGGHDD